MTTGFRRLVDSFVPDLGASWLAEQPETRYRQISGSMVHADISGSTRLSEQLADRGREGTELLTDQINAAFTPIIEAAATHGGDVLKFGGDAILVFFTGEHHALRAVQGAAEMQRALAARPEARRVDLRMTVGAHTGSFDFWLVGDEDLELVVAGPAGSRVVEIEESAEPGLVVASPETVRALPSRGDTAGIVVFEEQGPRSSRPPAPEGTFIERLLSSHVVNDIQAVEVMHGEHRVVTTGFVVCQGIDPLLAAGRHHDVLEQLQRFFHSVQEAAQRFGVSYLHNDIVSGGVKILLAAGAPVSTGNDEEAMLRAIREIVRSPVHLELRGSAHVGRVFAGFLGSERRRTYTLMGDNVNLASHILTQADVGDIVATSQVLDRLTVDTDVRPLESFTVKGKTGTIDGALVDAIHSGQALPTPPGVSGEMVGRDAELKLLTDALAKATLGDGQAIEVVGETGVGKTTLVEAAIGSARGRLDVVRHVCDRFQKNAAYATARSVLRQALGIPFDAEAREAGRLLESVVADGAIELMPLVPLLGDVIDGRVESTREADAVGLPFRPARGADLAVQLLKRAERPILIVVEDGEWMDDVSRIVLHRLAREAKSSPMVVVLTRRSDGQPLEPDVSTTLLLRPLDGDDLRQLIINSAAPGSLTNQRLRSIAERSGGNPLFAVQLASSLASGQELPETVEALITSQVDELPSRARLLLRLSSVFGIEMDESLLQELVADQVDDYGPDDLAGLGAYLKRSGTNRLAFMHELQREVAYNGLPYGTRRQLHRSAGDLLEARAERGQPIPPATLTLHFSLAGDRERTWRYGREAGQRASARYANDEAADSYSRALDASSSLKSVDAAERYRLAIALGDVLELSGRFDEAEKAYQTAQRLAEQPLPTAQARQRRCWVRIRQGNYRAARRMQDQLLRALESNDSAAREIRRQVQLDRLGMLTRGDIRDEFEGLAQEVIQSANEDGDQLDEARAINYLLGNMAAHADPEIEEELAARSLRIYQQAGDEAGVASVMNNLGISRYFRGDWTGAVKAYEESRSAFERVGDDVRAATVDNNLGEILSDQGTYEPATRRFDDATRTWQAADYRIGLAVLSMNQGRLLMRQGRPTSAAEPLDWALSIFDDMSVPTYLAECRLRMAETAVVEGDGVRASALAMEARSIEERDEVAMEPWLCLVDACCADLADDQGAAVRHAKSALEASTGRYERLHALATLDVLGSAAPTDASNGSSGDGSANVRELLSELGIVDLPLLIGLARVDRIAE